MHLPPKVGRIIISEHTLIFNSNTVAVPDLLTAVPLPRFTRPVFIDQIGVRVGGTGTGSNLNCRLGLYKNRGGEPGELVFDSGVISLASLGGRFAQMGTPLPHSLGDLHLWAVALFQGGNTAQSSMAGAQTSSLGMLPMIGVDDFNALPTATSSIPSCLAAARAWADGFPADGSLVAWGVSVGTPVPLIGVRRSA